MAEHLREQILEAVYGKLYGLPSVNDRVYRLRIYPHEDGEQPSLNIIQGPDVPVSDADPEAIYIYIDRELTYYVDVRVEDTGAVDTELNRVSWEVTDALLADPTLGVTGCYHTEEGPSDEPETSGEGKKPLGLMRMTWISRYRTVRGDPSASS